jgi:hypothetical protein
MQIKEKKPRAQAARESRVHPHYHVQPGCLVYDITDGTPIGNKAFRSPEGGMRTNENEALEPMWYGCNRTGTWNGKRVAFPTEFTMEHYHDK